MTSALSLLRHVAAAAVGLGLAYVVGTVPALGTLAVVLVLGTAYAVKE
jgi:hypothetical protein